MFSDCAAALRRRPVVVIAAAATLMAIIAGSGIPTNRMETSIDALWIKTHGQVRSELDYLEDHRNSEKDSSAHILMTVDKTDDTANVLTKAHLLEQVAVQKAVADIEGLGLNPKPSIQHSNHA